MLPSHSVVRGTHPIHVYFKGQWGKPYGRGTDQGSEEELLFCKTVLPGKAKGVSGYSYREVPGLQEGPGTWRRL